jgi:FAD/FMN-containing dehydrogenase
MSHSGNTVQNAKSAAERWAAALGDICVTDAERLRKYEVPERGAPGRAACVLLPRTADEVRAVLRVANEHRLKLVISAGRTGLVEAQRPEGEAVLSLERLNRILHIDAAARTAEVEAGVSVDALNEALAPQGLVFPMEMGSTSAATVGGCVANGSAGANAVCYGTAAQMCEAAWGWWGDGSAAGPCAAPPWTLPPPEVLAINSAQVRPAWGLIGAQGVLGVITRLRLRLTPLPAQREAALIPANTMSEAMDILGAARSAFGADVEEFEFISRRAMELVRTAKGAGFRLPFGQDPDAAFYLLLQVKSARSAAEDDLPGRMYAFLAQELALPDERIGYAPLKALKDIRHSITESSNLRMKALGGGRLSFDTATPPARFGPYLDRLERDLLAHHPGYDFVAFGHGGVGGAHLHILGTREQPVQHHADEIIKRVFDITHAHGGTFSAEHGVGSKWGEEFMRRAPRAQIEALAEAKRARDPLNVLNPRCFALDRLFG